MDYNAQEIEIDLFDFCKDLFKNWKKIIVVFLAGCLIGGLFSLIKTDSIANYEDLEEEDIINIETAYRYRQQYNDYVKYNQNSYVLSFDASNVALGSIKFFSNTNISDLKSQIESAVYDEDTTKQIADLIGNYKYNFSDIVSINSSDLTDIGKINDSSVFITIKTKKLDTTNKIINIITNKLKTRIDPIVNTEVIYDSEIDKIQKDAITNTTTAFNNATNYEKKLSSDVKNYYTVNYLHEEIEECNPVKYIAIGGILGVIVACAYYLCVYVFSKTIKTRNEIKNYGLSEIATISLEPQEDETICSFKYLNSIINKLVTKKAILSYEIVDEEIINKLSKNKKIVLSKEIYLDDSSFNVANDGLIIVVEVKKTSKEFVLKTIETCRLLNIKIIGAIIVI